MLGQRSRSHEAEATFGDLAKISFSTSLSSFFKKVPTDKHNLFEQRTAVRSDEPKIDDMCTLKHNNYKNVRVPFENRSVLLTRTWNPRSRTRYIKATGQAKADDDHKSYMHILTAKHQFRPIKYVNWICEQFNLYFPENTRQKPMSQEVCPRTWVTSRGQGVASKNEHHCVSPNFFYEQLGDSTEQTETAFLQFDTLITIKQLTDELTAVSPA